MRRYLRLYGIFLSQYLKSKMQSKVDFFIGVFAFVLSQIMGVAFLAMVFQRIPDLNGWSFYQLVFIYGYAQIPRGIDHFVTDYLWPFARLTVREGLFDRYLLRPVSPLFQIIVEGFKPDGLGEIAVGLVLVFYSIGAMGLSITVGGVLLFILSVFAGAVIFAAVKILCATLAFFIKNSYQVLYLVHNTSDFAKYPLSIYNAPVRIILSFIIPFAFTAFIPASYFLGQDSLLFTVGAEVLIAVVFLTLAYQFFKFGCTRYESAGN